MARKVQSPQMRQAQLSIQDKRKAIEKIKRRIEDINDLDIDSVDDRADPRISALEERLDKLLVDIFGVDTHEYDRYKYTIAKFNRGSINLVQETPIGVVRDSLRQSMALSKARLEVIRSAFIEDLEDAYNAAEPEALSNDTAWGGLHSEITANCSDLYDAGHYPEAVEKSFKIVRDRLRTLTSFEKGSEAFGKTGLHIKGAAAPHVEKDFNAAVKFLTMAIDMFRNEKSHTSDGNISDPNRAFHYLSLSSLAMHLLDGAEIRK